MPQDPSSFLNELTIWKLKAVADEYGIDVASCKSKRDYVQKLASKKINEEQVRSALDKMKKVQGVSAKEGPESELKAIGSEVESISKAPTQPSELPEEDEESVEKHLDEAIMLRPRLLEVDSMTEAAYGKMIVGDYYETIKLNREARTKCLEEFSSYQVYSTAVSIRAADELFSRMVSEKTELDPILRTALAESKRALIDGPPKRREETLESLEVLATKAYDAFVANTEKDEAELRGLLADYESFGTRTEESKRYLEVASQARRTMNVAEYSKLLKDARDQAERAKDIRTKEIDNSFHIVKAAAIEAGQVGVDTSAAESSLKEARKAFEDGEFRRAVDLLSSIERQVDVAHLERIREQRDLEEKQLDSVRATVAACEPTLLEAASYGIDVNEGLLHVGNAKSAVSRSDAVNGVKFARRVKDIAASIEKDLDSKRLERGIIKHVDGVKCGKCGRESLYSYPDMSQKCMECGHAFSVMSEPAVTPGPTVTQAQTRPLDEGVASEQKPAVDSGRIKRRLKLQRK